MTRMTPLDQECSPGPGPTVFCLHTFCMPPLLLAPHPSCVASCPFMSHLALHLTPHPSHLASHPSHLVSHCLSPCISHISPHVASPYIPHVLPCSLCALPCIPHVSHLSPHIPHVLPCVPHVSPYHCPSCIPMSYVQNTWGQQRE